MNKIEEKSTPVFYPLKFHPKKRSSLPSLHHKLCFFRKNILFPGVPPSPKNTPHNSARLNLRSLANNDVAIVSGGVGSASGITVSADEIEAASDAASFSAVFTSLPHPETRAISRIIDSILLIKVLS